MQHSSLEARLAAAGNGEQGRSAPVFPNRTQVTEFSWSNASARQRLVHGFDSRNASSRSFNLIRSKLVALRRERDWRMIGIASAAPGVGKSFVSSNVAAAMSRDPRFQTYLMDLDLRRGTVRDIFGIETDTGIVEYLEGTNGEAMPFGFSPKGQDLIIIPTVPGMVHSSELLANDRGTALFRAMRDSDERNFFICDLPPVFANDDASIIMEALDAYVLVVQDGKTTQREIQAVVEMLGHERLAGVVLNRYRGGVVSEGYGIEDRYASEYYARSEAEDEN